jgi:hypothetical protein
MKKLLILLSSPFGDYNLTGYPSGGLWSDSNSSVMFFNFFHIVFGLIMSIVGLHLGLFFNWVIQKKTKRSIFCAFRKSYFYHEVN